MGVIEEIGSNGAKSPGRRFTSSGQVRTNKELAALLLPSTRFRDDGSMARPAPTPEPTRFTRTDVTKLTPFTMPVEEKPDTSAAPITGSGSWRTYGEERSAHPNATGGSWATYGQQMMELREQQQKDYKPKPVEPKAKTRRSYAMTWEDYNRLTDDQREAVDFNTMLVQAREKDLNADYKATPQQKQAYENDVRKLFGEDGGSETYAPETMKLLRQVDYKAQEGDDLDNFLGLKAAISEKELAKLDIDLPDPIKTSVPEYVSAAVNYNRQPEVQLGDITDRLETSLAKGRQLLANLPDSAALARNTELLKVGGTPNDPRLPFGWGADRKADENKGIDEFFQNQLNLLTFVPTEDTPSLGEVWANFEAAQLNPAERRRFMQFADTRTRQAIDTGVPMIPKGKTGGNELRTPEQIRELLGLDRNRGDR